jgi:hypothetical protein
MAEPARAGPSTGGPITSETPSDGVLIVTIPASGNWKAPVEGRLSNRSTHLWRRGCSGVSSPARLPAPGSEHAFTPGMFRPTAPARAATTPVFHELPGHRAFDRHDRRPGSFVSSSETAVPNELLALRASGRARLVGEPPTRRWLIGCTGTASPRQILGCRPSNNLASVCTDVECHVPR